MRRTAAFTALMITAAGVVGAVLLLVASAHHPHAAVILRLGALVWFIAVGVVRLVFDITERSAPGTGQNSSDAEPSRLR